MAPAAGLRHKRLHKKHKSQVHLLKTICLPVLLYAVEVIPANKSDISMLNHVIDRAVFRIFSLC